MRTNLTRSTIAAVLLAVTLGAACGGDDDTATTDPASADTNPAPSDTAPVEDDDPDSITSGTLACTGSGELTTPDGVVALDGADVIATVNASFIGAPVSYQLPYEKLGGGAVSFDAPGENNPALVIVGYGGALYYAPPTATLDIREDGASLDVTTVVSAAGADGPHLTLDIDCG